MKIVATLAFALLWSYTAHATETRTDTVWSIGPDRVEGFGSPKDVEFSEDMQYLIVGTDYGNIVMLNIADGSTKSVVLFGPADIPFEPGSTPQGVYLEVLPQIHCVAVAENRTFRLYSYPSWTLMKEITLPGKYPVQALRVTPDASVILYQDDMSKIYAVDGEGGQTRWQAEASATDALFAMSGDGRLVAAPHADNRVELWEVSTGTSLGKIPATGVVMYDVDISFDGSKILIATTGEAGQPTKGPGALTVWDINQRRIIWELRSSGADNQGFFASLFTPRGSGVYTGKSEQPSRGQCLYHIGDSVPVRSYIPSSGLIMRGSPDSSLGLGFDDSRIWLNRISWSAPSTVQGGIAPPLTIYPNPSNTGWTVDGLPYIESVQWTLTSLNGQVIQQGLAMVLQGQAMIPASGLSSGAYLLKLMNGPQVVFSSHVQIN